MVPGGTKTKRFFTVTVEFGVNIEIRPIKQNKNPTVPARDIEVYLKVKLSRVGVYRASD